MTRTHSYLSIHKLTVLALCAVAGISIFLYVSLMIATIVATAGRSHAAANALRLTSRIGDLDQQYLSLGNSITASEASARGFVQPKVVTIATALSGSGALSIHTR